MDIVATLGGADVETGERVAIEGGSRYLVSFQAHGPDAGREFRFEVQYRDAAGNWLSRDRRWASGQDGPLGWTEIRSSFTTPRAAASARPILIVERPNVGEVHRIDHVVILKAPEVEEPTTTTTTPPSTAKPRPGRKSSALAHGYVVSATGDVTALGNATHRGDVRAAAVPVVGVAESPMRGGYWVASADGGVDAFGAARSHGSMRGRRLAAPIVGIDASPSGRGYVLVAADGGVFTFGDARFHGSTGRMRLAAPIVDIALTPSGHGYWLVARDGGVFSFGDAHFYGSTGGLVLRRPIVSMASASDGHGYWLLGADGGVFAFSARYRGSLPALGVTETAVAIDAIRKRGYLVTTADGSIYAFRSGSRVRRGAVGSVSAPLVDLDLK
jgi:hypothetical protein